MNCKKEKLAGEPELESTFLGFKLVIALLLLCATVCASVAIYLTFY